MGEEDLKGLRRELDKELISVVKSIPQLETKIDDILTILKGDNGNIGLVEKVSNIETREVKIIAYATGVWTTIVIVLKIISNIY